MVDCTKVWLAMGLLVALVPFFLANYRAFQMSQLLVMAIALLGLNFLTGFRGQISLGHGAFFAIGGYFAVVVLDKFGWPYWCAIPMAGVFCLVCGFLFSWPALRLEGPYLALATFALAVTVPQLLKHDALSAWTGGVQGINLDKIVPPAWWSLSADHWLYFVCLVVAVALFAIVNNLVNSRVGRALVALRESPVAALAMGIDRSLYSAITFGLSAMITGIGGALGVMVTQFVSPDSFGVFVSITFLIGIVVGGVATLSGALWGAVFIQFMPQVAEHISKAAPWTIYGVVLIAVVYMMPNGVAGLIQRLRGK